MEVSEEGAGTEGAGGGGVEAQTASLWVSPPWEASVGTKVRDITLPIKVCLVKAMVFPIVMYGCEVGL